MPDMDPTNAQGEDLVEPFGQAQAKEPCGLFITESEFVSSPTEPS